MRMRELALVLFLGLGVNSSLGAQSNGCGDCANHTIYEQFPDGYIERSACPQEAGCWWMINVSYSGAMEYTYWIGGSGGYLQTDCYDTNGMYIMC